MLASLKQEKWLFSLFLILCLAELTFIVNVSDLQVWLGNWEGKSREILGFNVPSSNFYGPGSALLLLPFLWSGPSFLVPVYFYFVLGCIAYFLLTRAIGSLKFRVAALLVIPANPYLLWLCHSSQDTVFEFALLTWSIYFLSTRKWISYSIVTFLLAQTRAGYWTLFLGLAVLILLRDLMLKKKLNLRKYLAIPLLLFTAVFNFAFYGSPSPALEGGITAYFSHSKYLHLSLPKMDMDVFLSGNNGIFSEENGPEIPSGASEAESNSIYQKAALESIAANPKEFILNTMQKFESYIFGVQKVPNLPGEYVLDIQNKRIEIGDERHSWNLILGNLVYEIYRSILLAAGLMAAGALIFLQKFNREKFSKLRIPYEYLIPWAFGAIPAVLLYTETRFKVVTETLLFLLIIKVWAVLSEKQSN